MDHSENKTYNQFSPQVATDSSTFSASSSPTCSFSTSCFSTATCSSFFSPPSLICTEKFHDFEKTTQRTQQNGEEAAEKAFEKSKAESKVDDNGEESDLKVSTEEKGLPSNMSMKIL